MTYDPHARRSDPITKTTAEAEELLKGKYPREIAAARAVAIELICERGETHMKELQEEIVARGMGSLLEANPKNFWLGMVFRKKDVFKPTGRVHVPLVREIPRGASNKSKNKGHSWRDNNIWTLTAEYARKHGIVLPLRYANGHEPNDDWLNS